MRTATNLYFGENERDFLRLLKEFFPDGALGVLYDDNVNITFWDKELTAMGYKISFYNENTKSIDENVRFLAVIGHGKILPLAKRLAKDVRYCYYTDRADMTLFAKNDLKGGTNYAYADFVYFDAGRFDTPECIKSVYGAIFTAATALSERLYDRSSLPYEDRTERELLRSLKKFLLEKTEKEVFFKEGLRAVKNTADLLSKEGDDMVFCYALPDSEDANKMFINNYFVLTLLIIFTKWNFFDILIPCENPIPDVGATVYAYRDESVLFTKEELHCVCLKFRGLTVLDEINPDAVLKNISEKITSKERVLAQIKNKGIILGLENGCA